MAIYTVHRFDPVNERDEAETVFVKEAFAWPAFFFTGLWAFWNRMWLAGVVLIAVQLALNVGLTALGVDPVVRGIVLFGYLVIVGFFANDWRRRTLRSKGYAFEGVVSGETRETAARRYYDHAR
ncbi:MAG: DUF2628 domain-containing protein [Alphaproteobacteria bacterium]|nr:DUF2628 domain-containing protein [Alphaproteobacteria bacterium]